VLPRPPSTETNDETRATGILGSSWNGLKSSSNPVTQGTVRAVRAGRQGVDAFRESKHPVPLFLRSAQYRSTLWMRMTKGEVVHQTAARTWMDRYPDIFTAVRDHLGASSDVAILSFGCSTGEEIVSLRQYLPQARLVGAEINERSLAICRARPVDDRIAFVYSSPEHIEAHAPYDAIFCMAVLQRDPHNVAKKKVQSLKDVYPFERFDEQITLFDRWLKPGGLMVVHNAHYQVIDATVYSRYEPLDRAAHLTYDYVKFGRDSALIGPAVAAQSVHLKKS
jgi:hypothetical protein